LRTLSLFAATISMGLVAGVFALYAHTIMPGLRRTDDRTFVGAFQSIDRVTLNPWFLGSGFLGALGLTVLAAIALLGEPALPWIGTALVLYLVTVVITVVLNVPLNAFGNPNRHRMRPSCRFKINNGRMATVCG
jgi:uncharacterized membrane protein